MADLVAILGELGKPIDQGFLSAPVATQYAKKQEQAAEAIRIAGQRIQLMHELANFVRANHAVRLAELEARVDFAKRRIELHRLEREAGKYRVEESIASLPGKQPATRRELLTRRQEEIAEFTAEVKRVMESSLDDGQKVLCVREACHVYQREIFDLPREAQRLIERLEGDGND